MNDEDVRQFIISCDNHQKDMIKYEDIEEKASKLEVTCDYYIQEFM